MTNKYTSCPICSSKLKEEHRITHIDYHCTPIQRSHHYAVRVKDDNILMIKMRVSPNQRLLYLKVDYVSKFLEVWEDIDNVVSERIKVDTTIDIVNFDLERLEEKISTYLMLS